MEEQLNELGGPSEGSVRGEKDPAVVLLLAAGVEEVVHQQAQVSGLQAAHLAGPVLYECRAGGLLTGVGGGDRLPTESYPIDCAVLELLAPFLHRVLERVAVGDHV